MPDFVKIALTPVALKALAQRGLGGLGVGLGVGGSLGATLGAGAGAVQGAEGGETTADKVRGALVGALGGASRGAIIGAGVGGLGMAGAGMTQGGSKLLGRLAQGENAVGSLGRFGQRQVHSVTGWTPKGFHNPQGVREMRGGAYDAAKRFSKAREGIGPLPERGPISPASRKAVKEYAGSVTQLGAAEDAERMGLTSVPGVIKSMKDNGIGKTIATGIGEQWHSGPMGKLMVGLPVAGAAKEMMTPGENKGERVGGALGGLGYSMAPVPFLGSMVAGGAIMKGMTAGGRGIDKLRAKRRALEYPASSSVTLDNSGSVGPVEHQYSPAALGQPPADMIG